MLLSAGALHAQTYKFQSVGLDQGLSHPFVHTLLQDDNAYLWLGTGEGLCKYDGRNVKVFHTSDGLAEDFVRSSMKDAAGKLWFGHNEGGISRYDHGRWEHIEIPAGVNSSINALVPGGEGNTWAITQSNGLLCVSEDVGTISIPFTGSSSLLYSIVSAGQGLYLIGASDGVHLMQENVLDMKHLQRIKAMPEVQVNNIVKVPGEDRFLIGSAGYGLFELSGVVTGDMKVRPIGLDDGLGDLLIKQIAIDDAGKVALATFGEGAFELTFNGPDLKQIVNFHEGNGLGTNNVSTVLIDLEQSIWLGRFGMDAARMLDRSIVFHSSEGNEAMDIRALFIDKHHVYFGGHGIVLRTRRDNDRNKDTLSVRNGLPNDNLTAILKIGESEIWVGSERSGVFRSIDNGAEFKKVFLGLGQLSDRITAIRSKGNEIWLSSSNGLFILNGDEIKHLTTDDGLMHNQVNNIFIDKDQEAWLACNNGGITRIGEHGYQSFSLAPNGEAYHVTSITVDEKNKTWFGTYGDGLYRNINGDLKHWTSKQGLRSDFCYSLVSDRNGSVWTGHAGGISRTNITTGEVKRYGRDHGITQDCRTNAAMIDEDGNVWFGTDHGAVRYDPARDKKNTMPPVVNILEVRVSDERIDLDEDIDLPPDVYKIRFEFLGVSLKDPDQVTYQYMLEGYDPDWSEATTNGYAVYSRVEDGSYRFLVRACNSDGVCSERSLSLPLSIQAPIWKRWWFIAGAIALVILAINTFYRIRERNQLRIREYLQTTLDKRTKEVKAKSVELERKNKDITDSITYARRIQDAILPTESQLREFYPNSFIYHQPRDIVSGDFYWFKRFDDKLVVTCADCTGHGVPGAFMSMIGTMLLRDLSELEDARSPEIMLSNLDQEVRNILHRHGAEEQPNDGMDIIVCELDLNTRLLRVSGAMQDLIIFRNGAVERLKGTRQSVGGHHFNGSRNHFHLNEIQLEPGDRIYMFSDGVPDQFGGLNGKKLKMSGMMDMLEGIAPLTMEEQAVIFRNKFLSWKHGFDQVDDVLFMGLEV